MITKLFCVAFVIVTASAWREQVELEGAKAYAVYPETEEHYSLLKEFHLKSGGIDFIQYPQGLGGEGRVVVSKETQTAFESLLRSNGISFKVYMKDVKATVEEEIRANEAARLLTMRDSNERFGFTAYHRHEAINAHLDTLEANYPHVKVIDAGESFEGRKIKQVLISTTGGTDASKPVIIAEGGNHAREWIGPAQAMYMIHKLLEDTQGVDPNIINNIDWVIIPVLNPDGYEYTHSTYRMWRKTRSTSTSSMCPGVDGNRNFGFQWMYSGSSSNPCTDIYAGPEEFSETESKVLRDTVMKYKDRAKAYMAIHSSGSLILYPYGYNGQPTRDNAVQHSVAEAMSGAINAYIAQTGSNSLRYRPNNAGIAFRPASGATEDWAYEVGKIKLSYTLELQAGSPNGFHVAPEKIFDVVKETWEGIVVLAKHVIE